MGAASNIPASIFSAMSMFYMDNYCENMHLIFQDNPYDRHCKAMDITVYKTLCEVSV